MIGKFDIVIIGGGLVGLAAAYQILRNRPGTCLCVLEKEGSVALHQSSRNSGVIHSGIYYRPGSLKALNCIRGKQLLENFCLEQNVSYRICGKLIVAKNEAEIPALMSILERGRGNGISCELVNSDRMREIEPHVIGVKAILVHSAGVVDFPGAARALEREIRKMGAEVRCSCSVQKFRDFGSECIIETSTGEVTAQKYVNCSGLYSDRVARLSGLKPACTIVPFRGEYYVVRPEKAHLCKALIYPVPNPAFPFLGVHLTRSFDGVVDCGPNAVLAFSREGYSWGTFVLRDFLESIRFKGFWRLTKLYWKEGFDEILRSLLKSRFVRAAQELVPEIEARDLVPAPAGVRAQALTEDGKLVDDFLIEKRGRGVHVLNAPSPAATSCLSIGQHIADQLNT